MKSFIKEYKIKILFIIVSVNIIPIFIIFTFHSTFIGTDELRTTFVSREIVNEQQVYFKDINNTTFDTKAFVKPGFSINDKKFIFPVGFTLNSLILVPVLALISNNTLVFNSFALLVFYFSFVQIYLIFSKLGIDKSKSIAGAVVFSLANYQLAMSVTFYPDPLLIFMFLTLINLLIEYDKNPKNAYLFMVFIISGFLIAFKITMYPIMVTFYFLFFLRELTISKKILPLIIKSFFLFIIVLIFNIPQLYTSTFGAVYGDLSQVNNQIPQTTNVESTSFGNRLYSNRLIELSIKFYKDFLYPKEHGRILLSHIGKDILFFGNYNFIVLIGFTVGLFYLYKQNKKVFVLVFLITLTSFILWGNMNVYGGGGIYSLDNLRNTHIRYMLPVITILYILGFYYFRKVCLANYLLIFVSVYTFIRLLLSLETDYPFNSYSLINKQGYFYDYSKEENKVLALHLPHNSYFMSACFDDYDLSYYYTNYADLKVLAGSNHNMENLLFKTTANNKVVYVLFPKKDSRFNPISDNQLNQLYSYITGNFNNNVIFEDDYKKLLAISKK